MSNCACVRVGSTPSWLLKEMIVKARVRKVMKEKYAMQRARTLWTTLNPDQHSPFIWASAVAGCVLVVVILVAAMSWLSSLLAIAWVRWAIAVTFVAVPCITYLVVSAPARPKHLLQHHSAEDLDEYATVHPIQQEDAI